MYRVYPVGRAGGRLVNILLFELDGCRFAVRRTGCKSTTRMSRPSELLLGYNPTSSGLGEIISDDFQDFIETLLASLLVIEDDDER